LELKDDKEADEGESVWVADAREREKEREVLDLRKSVAGDTNDGKPPLSRGWSRDRARIQRLIGGTARRCFACEGSLTVATVSGAGF
jgi:hypothetical protein